MNKINEPESMQLYKGYCLRLVNGWWEIDGMRQQRFATYEIAKKIIDSREVNFRKYTKHDITI